MDRDEVYAVPGEDSIIDVINPATGLTAVLSHTEEQVKEREPLAVRMSYADWRTAAIARQAATSVVWEISDHDTYHKMLNILPPICWEGDAFMVGEPVDHSFATGAPRFQAFRIRHGRYLRSSRPMTVAEFREGL